MAYWLLKTEPSVYSWQRLEQEGRATWDGVANAAALAHLRAARPGDLALVYHTGDERRAVGIAEVRSEPYADPAAGDPRRVVVDVAPRAPLAAPVGLAALKALAELAGSPLVRQGRLSVVPLTAPQWRAILRLGKTRS